MVHFKLPQSLHPVIATAPHTFEGALNQGKVERVVVVDVVSASVPAEKVTRGLNKQEMSNHK